MNISALAKRQGWNSVQNTWLHPKQGFKFIDELLDGYLQDQ